MTTQAISEGSVCVASATHPYSNNPTTTMIILLQPIRGTTVRFLAIVRRLTRVCAATDRRGRFRTAQLPLGQYNVEVSAPGYLAKSFELWSAACEPACERPLIIRLSPGCE